MKLISQRVLILNRQNMPLQRILIDVGVEKRLLDELNEIDTKNLRAPS